MLPSTSDAPLFLSHLAGFLQFPLLRARLPYSFLKYRLCMVIRKFSFENLVIWGEVDDFVIQFVKLGSWEVRCSI